MTRLRLHIAAMLAALALIAVGAKGTLAAATVAGTPISNTATVSYIEDLILKSVSSNTVTFKVDEIINASMVWQDASPVQVGSGSTGQALTLVLTNTGNGNETFSLSANPNPGGADFVPTVTGIYIDNGNGIYEPGVDTLYVPGSNDPALAPGGSVTLFVVSTMPTGLNPNDTGMVALTASSTTGTGPLGTIFPSSGDTGTDAVIGSSGGTVSATGTYIIVPVAVNIQKTSAITAGPYGSEPLTGATITYTLTVTVIGSGTASNIVITDSIPANTTYVTGSLKLNGGTLTDNVTLDDAGDYNLTNAGAITVTLGSIAAGSPAQTITFDVNIN